MAEFQSLFHRLVPQFKANFLSVKFELNRVNHDIPRLNNAHVKLPFEQHYKQKKLKYLKMSLPQHFNFPWLNFCSTETLSFQGIWFLTDMFQGRGQQFKDDC